MLLESLLKQKPEDVFLYLERRVNARYPKFPYDRTYADVDEFYKPDGNNDNFNLPFVILQSEEANYFEVDPDERIKNEIQKHDKLRFFIHPEMLIDYKKKNLTKLLTEDGHFVVSPTSSTRTVFTRNLNYNFMLKVHLERKLGENIRHLKKSQVEHSNKISKELKDTEFPENLAYLPESIGVVYSYNGEEIGMITREFEPKPKTENKKYLLPFFSLFSLDKNKRQEDVLLCQIIENMDKRGGNESDIFFERLLKPYINMWTFFVLQKGFNPDMHGQNILLEIDEKGIPTRIVYRDFQDFFIDSEIRKIKKLHTNFNRNVLGSDEKIFRIGKEIIEDQKKIRKIAHSFSYDYKIGRILDYFSIVLSKYSSCEENKIIETSKEIFRSKLNGTHIMPEKAYFLQPGQNNFEKEFVFMEVEPKYR